MQNMTPHSASPNGEATVPNSSRFFKTSDPPTERLYRSVNQEQPAGTAVAPAILMNITRSAVTIRSPEAPGVNGLVDNRPAAPPRRGHASAPREGSDTRLKRTRSESDPEPDWPRRPLAELSESTHNSGGGDSTRPCVPQQGCLDGDIVAPPRPNEAPDEAEATLPLVAPAQPGSDCLLVADAKSTSAPGAAEGTAPTASGRDPTGRGAAQVHHGPEGDQSAVPWPTEVVPTPTEFDPHYGVAGSLEGAPGVWKWQWNAGSRSSSCPLAKSQHEMGCTCGDPPRHEWMFIPDDSFLANLLKVGLVDLERMETRAYDQFAILDEGLFNTEASFLLDERMRRAFGSDESASRPESLGLEYTSLRKIILDHYEALAAVAAQWVSSAVQLLSGSTTPSASRPPSPPPSRVSYAAAALANEIIAHGTGRPIALRRLVFYQSLQTALIRGLHDQLRFILAASEEE